MEKQGLVVTGEKAPLLRVVTMAPQPCNSRSNSNSNSNRKSRRHGACDSVACDSASFLHHPIAQSHSEIHARRNTTIHTICRRPVAASNETMTAIAALMLLRVVVFVVAAAVAVVVPLH